MRSAPQNTFSSDYTDFLDSIDSTESTDIIHSIDSILVPHKETANIHTTHKGKAKVPMGAAPKPPSALLLSLCVCGVNVGGLFVWHKYKISVFFQKIYVFSYDLRRSQECLCG